MKNNYDGKVKGHGYFRKTKAFGLASGIVLGAALILVQEVFLQMR